MAARILILTASVGEGHDLPARLLAEELRDESPGTEVVVADGLRAMGRTFVLVNERAAGVVFFHFRWIWDAAYWLFVHFAPTRRLTQRFVFAIGSRGLLRLIRDVEPDVVVSVYPMTTEVLGRLRRAGRLEIPACAAITDLAMMHYWAAPGIDLHLITHPETEQEVREVAGDETEVCAVRGLTKPEFSKPREASAARRSLGLTEDGKIVLVSGGGWGVGDLAGAVDTALALDGVGEVVCLCGRNEELRARLERRFADEPRVRVEGFTDRMGDWLAAGDALVHSTAGLTVLEAHMRGCPTVSYGWGRGHIRANNEAFARYGIAEVAELSGRARGGARARARVAPRAGPLVRRSSVRRIARARAHRVMRGRSGLRYGLLGTLAWAAPAPAAYVPLLARAFRIPLRLPHRDGVALTFDDGPHPQGTPAVLEALAATGSTATFFLVGEQVERFPALAAEIAAAGHEIAIHGYRHRLLLRRSPTALAADFDRAAAVIGEATGRAPSVYRPPYGVFSGPASRSSGAAAGRRGSGRNGAGTGRRTRPPSRSRRERRRGYGRATSCCCTTPTTTARPAPGAERLRRCLRCSRRWPLSTSAASR